MITNCNLTDSLSFAYANNTFRFSSDAPFSLTVLDLITFSSHNILFRVTPCHVIETANTLIPDDRLKL